MVRAEPTIPLQYKRSPPEPMEQNSGLFQFRLFFGFSVRVP